MKQMDLPEIKAVSEIAKHGLHLESVIYPNFKLSSAKGLTDYYLRIYKPSFEQAEINHFYCRDMNNQEVIPFPETRKVRDSLSKEFASVLSKQRKIVTMYFVWDTDSEDEDIDEDFSFETETEYAYMKEIIDNSLKNTGVELLFLLSHMQQRDKDESYHRPHFHAGFVVPAKSNEERVNKLNRFIGELRWYDVVVKISYKG